MIVGNDISEFQGAIDWNIYKNNTNFVLMKASEGSSYIDKWFGGYRQEARLANLPRGFYHFARPDLGNTPEAEAQFFFNLLNGQPLQEGEILCLDYEVQYHDPVGWCKAWLDKVYELTTVRPLIYLNQSTVAGHDWSSVSGIYGLWLASYQADGTGNTGQWAQMAFQQTSSVQQVPGISGNVDRDVFFGEAVQFKAYGFKPVPTTPTTPTTVTPTTTDTTVSTLPPETPVITEPVQTIPPVPPTVPPVIIPTPPKLNWWKSLWQTIKQFLHL